MQAYPRTGGQERDRDVQVDYGLYHVMKVPHTEALREISLPRCGWLSLCFAYNAIHRAAILYQKSKVP